MSSTRCIAHWSTSRAFYRLTIPRRGQHSMAGMRDTQFCLMNVQIFGWAAVACPARYGPGGGVKMS
jgi:hypothetical protein